ncbi:hypothetical protein GSI_05313 [Ganoderma sinense ZZ0214-1]|uniref:Uncharacterized protein n=1 Tax=Ganoderma sinense ZZ0214-1 TaxID=1077348 RepID=A0A2G8SFQ8_9APHY|nr:hypothetical protein GSI_05313 [Ganoderma sinense ZZ0214-1]
MKSAIAEVEPITPATFFDYLGKRKFYSSYRAFFAAEILRKGAKAVLEGFIFPPSANLVPASSGPPHANTPPRMPNRLLAGLVHPPIHACYGLQFGLPGLLAEGLGQAAIHPVDGRKLIPLPRFREITPASAQAAAPSDLFLRRMTYGLQLAGPPGAANGNRVHALQILGGVTAASFDEDLVQLADKWSWARQKFYGKIV